MLSFRIVRDVVVSHGRQFTGGVRTGVSMIVRAVGNDFRGFVGQELGRQFLDLFGRNIQRARDVSLAITLWSERFDNFDRLLPI